MGAIRTLRSLQDNPDQPCAAADQIARARLAEVEQRIASLMALKAELQRMVSECACGRVAECRVIEILADHGQCQNKYHQHQPCLGNQPVRSRLQGLSSERGWALFSSA